VRCPPPTEPPRRHGKHAGHHRLHFFRYDCPDVRDRHVELLRTVGVSVVFLLFDRVFQLSQTSLACTRLCRNQQPGNLSVFLGCLLTPCRPF